MASTKMLALLALACMASVAQGSLLFDDDVPEVVSQQRALLQTKSTPAYYSAKNERIFASVALLVRLPKGATATQSLGATHLTRNIKAVQKRFNAANKAHNNLIVTAVKPLKFKGQAWVYYRVGADIGPAGASYKAALKSALRSAIRKRSKFVVRVRGNFAA